MVPGIRLVVLGKQGAGKGTQCVRLARHYIVPHISTGDMLRSAVRAGTEFGRMARQYMEAGELVPDDVMVGLVKERLDRDDTMHRGFILDGFPRTTYQAEQLEAITAPGHIDLAVYLEIPTEVVLERLAGRRVCTECGANYSPQSPPKTDSICDVCGGEVVQRKDDTEGAIRRRLALYEQETAPLIAWYEKHDKSVTVDAVGHPDEVHARLIRAIDDRRQAIPVAPPARRTRTTNA